MTNVCSFAFIVKAEEIMREAIKGDNSVDRWAAAQCLAHYGVCDPVVVGELIQQLLSTEDSIKHERAISLLAKVSSDSVSAKHNNLFLFYLW